MSTFNQETTAKAVETLVADVVSKRSDVANLDIAAMDIGAQCGVSALSREMFTQLEAAITADLKDNPALKDADSLKATKSRVLKAVRVGGYKAEIVAATKAIGKVEDKAVMTAQAARGIAMTVVKANLDNGVTAKTTIAKEAKAKIKAESDKKIAAIAEKAALVSVHGDLAPMVDALAAFCAKGAGKLEGAERDLYMRQQRVAQKAQELLESVAE